MAWRWVAASEIGTSHIRSGNRLEDAYVVSTHGDDHVFAVVSDGAGSAKFGAYGAWIVCRTLAVHFRQWLSTNKDLPDDETAINWIDNARDHISAVASRRNTVPRQFAATLAAVLISPNNFLALHIGDSGIVARRASEWEVICWPENGEYASTTYFVTDDPEPRLNIIRRQLEHDSFALFSDGVGDLALSQIEQKACPQFFGPMMRPVDSSPDTGRLPELSSKLRTYLAGPTVCDRTDDDKTLILLSGA